jgi:hypothetical protein
MHKKGRVLNVDMGAQLRALISFHRESCGFHVWRLSILRTPPRSRQDFAAHAQACSGIFVGRNQVVDVAFIYCYNRVDHHIGHWWTPLRRG